MSDPWYLINSLEVRVVSVGQHFAYNDPVTRTQLIGNGDSSNHNEVLQTGALGNRTAQYQLVVLDKADVDELQGYHATSETVTWTTRFGTTHECVVTGCAVSEARRDLWNVGLTLVEIADPDSGSS